MFEMTGRLAEKAAAGVSRRRFLGSLGRFAAAAALAVAGTLAFGGKAGAGGKPCGILVCPPGTRCCGAFGGKYYCAPKCL